jgi:hypothetical protein
MNPRERSIHDRLQGFFLNPAQRSLIVQGDLMEILPALPDGAVNLTVTSPPYEDARLYGELKFKVKGDQWVAWAHERFVETVRVTNGLTAWVVEGKTRNYKYSATPLLLAASLHQAGVCLRKPPIYHRVGIPGSGGPDWLRNDYEFVLCAARERGRLPWSDNTAAGGPPKHPPGGAPSYRLADGTRISAKVQTRRKANGERVRDGLYKPPTKTNPGNVISGKVGGGLMGSPLAHESEAPFPEWLVEPFVKSFCPPGGIVLDPFGGSGTVLAVALKNGRRCISIDVRKDQCDIMRRRLAEIGPLGKDWDE